MEGKVASKLPTISPNATMRDIHDYCKKLNLPSVSQGMIELPPPPLLRKIASEMAVSDDVHTYRDRFGEPEFRNAVRDLLRRYYDSEVPADSIMATSGVSGGIFAALLLFRSRGLLNVGLIEPFYTYHLKQVEAVMGRTPAVIPSKADFSLDFDAIEAALRLPPAPNGSSSTSNGHAPSTAGTGAVDVVIICNPGNPSGRVFTADEIRRLVDVCTARGCGLIVDECYCDMIWHPNTHFSPIQDGLRENVVVCRGFSKCLGCQSWRVGYAVSDPTTVAALMVQHDPVYISTSCFQHALARYLRAEHEDYMAHLDANGSLMQRNWQLLAPAFEAALGWTPVAPDGSMYGVFRHNTDSDMRAVTDALADGHGVGVAPGRIFYGGSPSNTGYVRIHCGITEDKAKDIVERLERIGQQRRLTQTTS